MRFLFVILAGLGEKMSSKRKWITGLSSASGRLPPPRVFTLGRQLPSPRTLLSSGLHLV